MEETAIKQKSNHNVFMRTGKNRQIESCSIESIETLHLELLRHCEFKF